MDCFRTYNSKSDELSELDWWRACYTEELAMKQIETYKAKLETDIDDTERLAIDHDIFMLQEVVRVERQRKETNDARGRSTVRVQEARD